MVWDIIIVWTDDQGYHSTEKRVTHADLQYLIEHDATDRVIFRSRDGKREVVKGGGELTSKYLNHRSPKKTAVTLVQKN